VWSDLVSREECEANVAAAGLTNVTLVRMSSTEAARAWSWSKPVDYLYVDADHSYEGCLSDLRLWWPHLKTGGLIAGDDYDDPRWGVTQAWDQFELEKKQTFSRRATPGSDPACTRLIWGVKQ